MARPRHELVNLRLPLSALPAAWRAAPHTLPATSGARAGGVSMGMCWAASVASDYVYEDDVMETMYQVGVAQAPRPTDPLFSTLHDALHRIREWGDKEPDTVFALWNITDVDEVYVVYLLFQSELYSKS